MNIAELVGRYPRLYHMAEVDAWPSIRARGLLSTSAILDNFGIEGEERLRLEAAHRPERYVITNGKGESMVLRDQKPMTPKRLAMALEDGLTPRDWYVSLNRKVFFWVSAERLARLMNAREYAGLEHDVLTIDTAKLLNVHAKDTWLCHMNSGNTFPVPHKRGTDTFKRIDDYPVRNNGRPTKEVVEVVVDYSVPRISDYVVAVRRMRDGQAVRAIHP